jgi:CrcB protein
MTYLLIAVGGAVGAPARYLVDRFVQARHASLFPWGTFLVNAVACLLLGLLSGLAVSADGTLSLLIGTGFCGALSTYSTFAFESWRLLEQRAVRTAAANALGSVVVGLASAAIGFLAGAGMAG